MLTNRQWGFWYSTEDNFIGNAQVIYHWYEFENYYFKMISASPKGQWVKTFRPKQNGRHFQFRVQTTFWREFSCMKTPWLKFVPYGPINNKPSLVQITAWRRTRDKPLSEPMMVLIEVSEPMMVLVSATNHYLNQSWPRFMSVYGVTRQ